MNFTKAKIESELKKAQTIWDTRYSQLNIALYSTRAHRLCARWHNIPITRIARIISAHLLLFRCTFLVCVALFYFLEVGERTVEAILGTHVNVCVCVFVQTPLRVQTMPPSVITSALYATTRTNTLVKWLAGTQSPTAKWGVWWSPSFIMCTHTNITCSLLRTHILRVLLFLFFNTHCMPKWMLYFRNFNYGKRCVHDCFARELDLNTTSSCNASRCRKIPDVLRVYTLTNFVNLHTRNRMFMQTQAYTRKCLAQPDGVLKHNTS